MLRVSHKGFSGLLHLFIFVSIWVVGGKTMEHFFFPDMATASFPLILFAGFAWGLFAQIISAGICVALLNLEIE